MNVPEEYLYSKEHEWVDTGDSKASATVGITDYAQDQLGDVVFVDLPETGTTVEMGDSVASLESVKAVSDVYSPVSGEILEVNGALEDSPEKINDAPYGDGWIIKLKLSNPKQLEELMSAADYAQYVEDESQT